MSYFLSYSFLLFSLNRPIFVPHCFWLYSTCLAITSSSASSLESSLLVSSRPPGPPVKNSLPSDLVQTIDRIPVASSFYRSGTASPHESHVIFGTTSVRHNSPKRVYPTAPAWTQENYARTKLIYTQRGFSKGYRSGLMLFWQPLFRNQGCWRGSIGNHYDMTYFSVSVYVTYYTLGVPCTLHVFFYCVPKKQRLFSRLVKRREEFKSGFPSPSAESNATPKTSRKPVYIFVCTGPRFIFVQHCLSATLLKSLV